MWLICNFDLLNNNNNKNQVTVIHLYCTDCAMCLLLAVSKNGIIERDNVVCLLSLYYFMVHRLSLSHHIELLTTLLKQFILPWHCRFSSRTATLLNWSVESTVSFYQFCHCICIGNKCRFSWLFNRANVLNRFLNGNVLNKNWFPTPVCRFL